MLEVQDGRPGIPDDRLERTQDRFHRVDALCSRVSSGTGLETVRTIVELHSGMVSVSNALDGAAFSVVFSPDRRQPS
jgi:signal transduction histidine kinase